MFTEEEIKELEPAPKPVIDLSAFIAIAKQGTYQIGVIAEDVKQGFTQLKKGQFILFRQYTAKECYGRMLWREIEKNCQLCTTCMPFTDKEGKIYTASTCVGVPLKIISHIVKYD